MAFAEKGNAADAEKELKAMREVAAKIPASATLFTTPVSVALKVGDDLLSGLIAGSRGDKERSIDLLVAAVASEGKVNYAEPPDWDLPVREWLGRAYLRSGQFVGAEQVYREEVARSPRNARALFGLAEALRKQGKTTGADLVQREFERAWASSDTRLEVERLYK